MESRTRNSKRNIIVGVLSNCVTPVFALIVRSVIVHFFSVEYLGLTSVFSSVFQVMNLAELGFSSAIIVNLYKPLKENDTSAVQGILAYYRRVYMTIGLLIFASGIIVCPLLNKLVGDTGEIKENIYILFLLYLLDTTLKFTVFAYKEALFNAVQRLDITKITYIIIYIIRSCLQLIAIAVFRNFYLYAIILVVSTAFYYIALNELSKKMYAEYYPAGKIDEITQKSIREQVGGLTVSKLVSVSRNSINPIIITSFVGLGMAGQYSNYCAVFNMVIGFFLIITKAIQASIGNSVVSETVEKNYADFTKMEFLQNIIITACTAYLVSLYQPFMELWMGKDLMFADSVMMLFVLNFYIIAMSEVRNAFFSALGYWWKAKWIFIVEGLMNIVLILGLGKLFGVTGIIIAPVLTLLLVNYIGITNLLFKEYFGFGRKEFYTNRIVYTFITLITCTVSYYSCNLVPLEGITGIVVRVVVCTFIVLITVPAMMFLLKRKSLKESIDFVIQIIKA